MRYLLFFFLYWTVVCWGAEVPILHEGRIRPLDGVKGASLESALVIPGVGKQWYSLEAFEKETINISAYSQRDAEAILAALRLHDGVLLKKALIEAYRSLEGSVFVKASNKSIVYPPQWKLIAEKYLNTWPWLELTVGLYALSLVKRGFFLPAFSLHSLLLLARVAILGRPPVSNMVETVLYVPWVAALFGLFMGQTIVATIVALGLLVVLWMTGASLSLENVQAVLDSQLWLFVHVLMVVGSYGVYAFAGVLGHWQLWNYAYKVPNPIVKKVLLQAMYTGTALLIPGTILGGVWAAQSWGRFWDWDPKESWAFVSSCYYLLAIHGKRRGLLGDLGLSAAAVLGLCFIGFTWYGVNYILGTGLHSYGFGDGGRGFFYLFLLSEIAFLTIMCWKIKKKNNKIAPLYESQK